MLCSSGLSVQQKGFEVKVLAALEHIISPHLCKHLDIIAFTLTSETWGHCIIPVNCIHTQYVYIVLVLSMHAHAHVWHNIVYNVHSLILNFLSDG